MSLIGIPIISFQVANINKKSEHSKEFAHNLSNKDKNIDQENVEENNEEAEKNIDAKINKFINDEQVGDAGKEIIKEQLQQSRNNYIKLLQENMQLKKLVDKVNINDFDEKATSIAKENEKLETKWGNILPDYNENALAENIKTEAKNEIEKFQQDNNIIIDNKEIQYLKEKSIKEKQKNMFWKNELSKKFKEKFGSEISRLEEDNNIMTEQAKQLISDGDVEEMINNVLDDINDINEGNDEGVEWEIADETLTLLSGEEADLFSCREEFEKFNTQYWRNIALQKIIKDNTQNEK